MTSRAFAFAGVVSLVVLSSTHPLAQTNPTFGQGAVRPGDGITPPTLVRQVQPEGHLPGDAGRKISGDIELEAVVNADGKVRDVRVPRPL